MREDAVARVQALALRVITERLDEGETAPDEVSPPPAAVNRRLFGDGMVG